ncbi:hypothetical protein [Novosphingobium humi]|uniref:Flagellar protein FliS n=1 Tax=Novosphingobium humi TaxID=2282397 RepID=A0ABY7TUP0_9SPHN|nr:hypothetical protein [Novosphingobium humi]WCT76331.1 hypothetical protein PQ457_10245 [Novosphingobium humi]
MPNNQPRFRGPVRVFAMARPRADAARLLIRAAMASMSDELSARSRAQQLARRVVVELIAANERVEPMEIALASLRIAMGSNIALNLALAPELGLEAELGRERADRFEARNWRQLSEADWAAETAEIAQVMQTRLAEKFRKA